MCLLVGVLASSEVHGHLVVGLPVCKQCACLQAIGCQASEAMTHLLQSGYVHLDIKPGNVLFNPRAATIQANTWRAVDQQAGMLLDLHMVGAIPTPLLSSLHTFCAAFWGTGPLEQVLPCPAALCLVFASFKITSCTFAWVSLSVVP